MRQKLFLFSTVLLFVLLSSCQPNSKDKYTDTLTEGVIRVAVDETFRPIIELEIPVFESMFPKAGIVPVYTTELNAVDLLLKDSVRMAVVTRPLNAKESGYLASKKFQPRLIKIASDGIALIVNKQNKDTLITVDQIRRILLGEAVNWNQLYPGSQLGEITFVFDNKNSSTIRYAIDTICGGRKIAGRINAQSTNEEVIEYVAGHRNAIGVIGVNWVSGKKDTTGLTFNSKIQVMSVSNAKEATPENSFKPYQAYLFYGYYPLVRDIFVILNDPRTGLSTGFTSFLSSDKGQRIFLKSGLLPATQPVRIVNIKEQ